jgi:hypothetical protein
VQPFRAAFHGLNRQRLQPVRPEVVPFVLRLFPAFTHTFSCRYHERRHVVALQVLGPQNVVAQAELVAAFLSFESGPFVLPSHPLFYVALLPESTPLPVTSKPLKTRPICQ